jgi:D-beta-D-heptose 7-phosphate kinase/D-beta-D-heptose 1-phosphate adenosyltransferase
MRYVKYWSNASDWRDLIMQQEVLIGMLDGFHEAYVLVLGDVMLDRFIYGSVERISPEAPIPVVSVERSMDMPGGAANVARNVAALGARAILLGVVGEDSWAEDLRTQLASSPTIDVHLVRDASRPTTVKTRYVADGQQVMRADREARAPLCADIERGLLDELLEVIDRASVVVLSDYAKGVLSDSVTRAVIEIARRAKKIIVVDPKGRDFSKYRGATILTPNRLELQAACGQACISQEQVVDGARSLLEQNVCDTMVITRGGDGMSVIDQSGLAVHLSTVARQVFDVSGAGDTVVATLALGLSCGGQVVEASTLANIAAGIAVGKRGTATVSTGEIIAELRPLDGRTDTHKIFSLERALQLTRAWREQGLKIAFTNGCFDLLHPGHISLLEQARRSADRLIVGLNADLSTRRIKGPGRPVQSEVARATVLAAIKAVDGVVIFTEDTPRDLIERLAPDVLVKGADYTVDTVVGADIVLGRGGKVLLAQILPGHSTTDTVKRVTTSSPSPA